VNQLKAFLKLIQLASSSQNIENELNKLQLATATNTSSSTVVKVLNEQQPQFKKPITSLTVKSRSEYMGNFKAIISQNLKIKTSISGNGQASLLNLTKLVVNNCDLRHIDKAVFELEHLTVLDFSQNKLPWLDHIEHGTLKELVVAHNEIARVGEHIRLPHVCVLDLSFNKLTRLDKRFCENFKNLSKLRVNNNMLKYVHDAVGYYLTGLNSFYANANELTSLPYSSSFWHLEMIEVHENPFEFNISATASGADATRKKFPSLVELCSRFVVNKK
jgi:Leucine-rich repeat (LRR) protein